MLILAAMLLSIAPLAAQNTPQPSPDKESFVIEPSTLASGAENATIRLVCNTPSGFSNSSSKAPAVKFSTGATLVAGSFTLLNQNEAECRVNIDRDAVGTVEVSLELYGVNGTTVLKTLRGTLGISGSQTVEGSDAKVTVDSVRLVRVNVGDPQTAGNISISGKITGTVTVAAPTGTTFFQAPKVEASAGSIATPKLDQANTSFGFTINNPGAGDTTVKLTDIRYATALFSASGGVEGQLACEISGGALSNQSALAVNAFTAKSTVEGSNDVSDQPAGDTGSESSDSTDSDTSAPVGSVTNPAPRRDDREDRPRNDRNREDRRRDTGTPTRQLPDGSPQPGAANRNPPPPPNLPVQPQQPGQQGQPAQGGAQPAPSTGGGSPSGPGTMGPGEAPERKPEDSPGTIVVPKKELVVTPGLHFCDKDFKPIAAVVLDRIISGEAGGRVWIMMQLPKDRTPDKVETVTVKLTLGNTTRELILTETGKNTGEFRCTKEGVLVIAEENPDSNEPDAAKVPPKPRYSNR
jgi:hypothetical protein